MMKAKIVVLLCYFVSVLPFLASAQTGRPTAKGAPPNQNESCQQATDIMKQAQIIVDQLDTKEYLLQRAIELCPQSPKPYNLLGVVYLKQDRVELATKLFGRALKVDPGYYLAHYNLGLVYKKLGQLDQAKASYEQALKIKPDHYASWLELQNLEKEAGKTPQQRQSTKNFDVLLREGQTAFNKEKYNEAGLAFREIIASDPKNARSRLYLGTICYLQQKGEKCLAELEQVEAIRPDFVYAPYLRSRILFAQGNFPAAQESAAKTARLTQAVMARQTRTFSASKGVVKETFSPENPNYVEILIESQRILGKIALQNNQYPEARKQLLAALEQVNTGYKTRSERLLFMKFKSELVTLVCLTYEHGQEYDAAITFLREQYKATPLDDTYHFQLGRFYELKKDIQTALAEYQYAFQQNSDHAAAATKILELVTDKALLTYNPKSAGQYAKELERCQGDRTAQELSLLAKAHWTNQDLGKAIYFMKQAVAKAPENTHYKTTLAEYQQLFLEE
jgi:tetratricopeptide (TPR) repeat protein